MGLLADNAVIAAISTGLTQSGISIIRMSGEDSINIADSLFINKNKKHILKDAGSHTLNYGFFCHGEEILDEVLVSVMKAPHSYTGEDVVEINCHGGIYITSLILEELLNNGARLAEPGEFTKRAFLNGRMDLTRAEAVMDMIASENEISRRISLNNLKGDLYDSIKDLREIILENVAYIESALDDPEHYDLDGYSDELLLKVDDIEIKLRSLIDSYNDGKIAKNGIRTVILGKPNAGKSSLMNLLSGHERAIVTDIPGTTRDILEQDIRIKSLGITLVDTAGIRDTDDYVEQIGVSKSIDAIKEADLIIYVADSSSELDINDEKILKEILTYDIPAIYLLNKNDLNSITDLNTFSSYLYDNGVKIQEVENKNVISFSVKNKTGLEDLKDCINDIFFKGNINKISDNVIISNSRHFNELKNSLDSILLVKKGIKDLMPEDFLTIDLMQAYESLGLIIGEEIGDDLVNEIFSKFCMGK